MTACAQCQSEFTKQRMGQRVCSPACASKIVRTEKKQAKERVKLDKALDKAAKEGMKTIPQLKKEAQQAFNEYIRERDKQAGHPCICCGRPLDWGHEGVRTHAVDAGHYRSTGSADHMRFDERNCHAQSVACNRYGAGRAVDYRIGLVARIGLDAVEALESDQTPIKWTRDTLRQIKTIYRAKLRDLKKEKRA